MGETAQLGKVLANIPDDLSSIPGMVEKEKTLTSCPDWNLCAHCGGLKENVPNRHSYSNT